MLFSHPTKTNIKVSIYKLESGIQTIPSGYEYKFNLEKLHIESHFLHTNDPMFSMWASACCCFKYKISRVMLLILHNVSYSTICMSWFVGFLSQHTAAITQFIFIEHIPFLALPVRLSPLNYKFCSQQKKKEEKRIHCAIGSWMLCGNRWKRIEHLLRSGKATHSRALIHWIFGIIRGKNYRCDRFIYLFWRLTHIKSVNVTLMRKQSY